MIPATSAQVSSPLFSNPVSQLVVYNQDGSVIELRTVIVSRPQDMQRGLMYVDHMTPDLTMLFLHNQPRLASMWMKNTEIPLDMWFVEPNMRIGHIAHNTVPHSLESIAFYKPVRAVVEINGGLSRLLGITEGSRIHISDIN